MRRRLLILALGLAGTLFLPPSLSLAGLASTRHNLSASGPGPVKATSESQMCVFCHAPHNASPSAPLWNKRNPGSTYTPYSSSTALARAGQPTGSSLVCLSCHDGTIALGELLNRATPVAMAGGTGPLPAGNTNLGTDLSDDHPVSIAYTSSLAAAHGGELADPATLTGKIRLDAAGQMQCTTCHDPHDNSNGKFLVVPNSVSALCQACHTKSGWGTASHRTSPAAWNGAGTNPWPHTTGTTVAANACENCHRPHAAGGRKWLLNAQAEENNCYPCHNGNVAAKNIQAEFTGKTSIHPVAMTTGVHDAAEGAVAQSRHVECSDCHNPHASNPAAGPLPGSLAGVRGVSMAGLETRPATTEYQICLRCHGDSPGKPASRTTRQLPQNNVRLEFDPGNPSFHPVAGAGKNSNVPSLLAPWTVTSTMKCGDCHNNNTGPGAGGTGPKGPHGSIWTPLLERQYVTTDRTSESAASYALCYKCHNRNSFINDGGAFPEHKKHVVEERTPCNVCHDPHGVSSTQGNSTNNSKLINFDTSVVTPSSSGQLKYVSTGRSRGTCYLRCHGSNHNPFSY
ncbi:MAG TPA: cytochrome c3 family protein [Rhodocyclaceae bacterium]|nr:cytochrome c3 family protein [Rhodocyclaceae bacterium]